MKKKNVSRLSEHTIRKGKVVTPFNYSLGDKLKLNSWTNERLPEYIWLGLILLAYHRKNGLEKSANILHEISKLKLSFEQPKFSAILSLPEATQITIYEIIIKTIEPAILSPLTLIYNKNNYPIFYKYFSSHKYSVEQHIETLNYAIKKFSPTQSNDATDIRYLVILFFIYSGRLHLAQGMENIVEAFEKYPITDHTDEKMRQYRPTVRSMEGVDFENNINAEFLEKFWRELGIMSECKPVFIKYKEDDINHSKYIEDVQKVIDYLMYSNKELSLSNPKFEVLLGSLTYCVKIFKEMEDSNLWNKILGRHAVRTIIEVYIMIKYLLKKESIKKNIWQEYQYYGISKYKLILLKSRETSNPENIHFQPDLIDILVNEKLWEEFIDVDLRYFDQLNIREKSSDVNEKELYGICYDYDSNYSHGLWGAIRESSMLSCDNPLHRYHNVPDVYADQSLPSVEGDCIDILNKIISLLENIYGIPNWFIEKYDLKK